MANAGTGDTVGVYGQSSSSTGDGMRGVNVSGTGITNGVHGIASSTSGRGVYGETTATSGDTDGVFGEAASTVGRGVRGLATASSGATTGVMGTATSTAGRGVLGMASASTGTTYGVYGESASTAGRGVYGRATALSGSTSGVYGESVSPNGRGVYGLALAGSGAAMGVYGRSDSTSGYGLYGIATASPSGVTYGVYAQSNSANGYGGYFIGYGADAMYVENSGSGRALQAVASNDTAVWARTDTGIAGVDGRAAGSTGRGVYGYATSTSGANIGVYGRTASIGGRGVYGLAEATSGTNIGVYGESNSPNGYAGYFNGNVHVNGTLSKGGGSFKIDHPLDPANKYLYHSFVESPDMMNIYNGNVTLDEQGEATVELPDWFEALNRDFRYQLTLIGALGARLYIAAGNRRTTPFAIAGGEPGMKVSWQVTGIRQDAYANAHRIPVEEDKPAEERGLYLHPAELGMPADLSLDYRNHME